MRRAATGSSGSCARPTASWRQTSISRPRSRRFATCRSRSAAASSSARSSGPATRSGRARSRPARHRPQRDGRDGSRPRDGRRADELDDDRTVARPRGARDGAPGGRLDRGCVGIMVLMFWPASRSRWPTSTGSSCGPRPSSSSGPAGGTTRPPGAPSATGSGPNMSTLVVVGTTAAWAYSVFVTMYPEVVMRAGLSGETYFDSSTIIIGLDPAREVARGAGQGPDDRRDPTPRRPPGEDGSPGRDAGEAAAGRYRRRHRDRRGGRPPARSTRREGARSTARHRRRLRGRRGDADGRGDAGHEGAGRRGDRGDPQTAPAAS